MQREERSIDDQVLAALQSPTLSGMPAVMNPKLISRHIGLITLGLITAGMPLSVGLCRAAST